MAITKNNRVLFNLTEGIDAQDFDDAQNFSHALMFDQVKGGMARDSAFNPLPTLKVVYAHPQQGYVIPSATALQVKSAQGPIYMRTGTIDGVTPNFLMYNLDPNELVFTVNDNLGGGSDRYDALCVQLAAVNNTAQSRDVKDPTSGVISTNPTLNKRTQVSLTTHTFQGTPGGGLPSVTSGWALWALVKLPAAFNGVFDPAVHIYDCRVPFGYQSGTVMAGQFLYSSTDWTNTFGALSANGGGRFAQCIIPVGHASARLLGLQFFGNITTGGTFKLSRHDLTSNADVYPPILVAVGSLSTNWTWNPFDADVPIWCHGYGNFYAPSGDPDHSNTVLLLEVKSGAAADIITGVRYAIAGA